MLSAHNITQEQHDAAQAEDIVLKLSNIQHNQRGTYPYFTDYIKTLLQEAWTTRRIAVMALFTAISIALTFIRIPLIPAAPYLIYDPSGIFCIFAGLMEGPLVAASADDMSIFSECVLLRYKIVRRAWRAAEGYKIARSAWRAART